MPKFSPVDILIAMSPLTSYLFLMETILTSLRSYPRLVLIHPGCGVLVSQVNLDCLTT